MVPRTPRLMVRRIPTTGAALFPFVRGHELTLSNDVTLNGGEQIGSRQAGFEIEVRVERVDNEMIVVHLARRRRGTAPERTAEAGQSLNRAADLGRHRHVRLERNVFRQSL